MKIHDFLCRHLPRPLADMLLGLWLALLICLVLFFAHQPELNFRYDDF